MNLIKQSKNINLNYAAKICRIDKIIPIPNADRLMQVVIDNNTVVTSKDVKVGDIVVYFPVECAIDPTYLAKNQLYSDYHLNEYGDDIKTYLDQADPNDESVKKYIKSLVGFFNKQGRVCVLKLRGVYSTGFIANVTTLERAYPELRTEIWSHDLNKQFDMIGDHIVCWKYEPMNKKQEQSYCSQYWYKKRMKKLKRFDRLIPGQFRFHYDTGLLENNMNLFTPKDVVDVTIKVHGTSVIIANILTRHKFTIKEKIKKFFGVKIPDVEYGSVYSSRKVIKNKYINPNGRNFYSTDPWGCVNRDFEQYLEPGMTVYGEIVGYEENTNKFIQKQHDYGCRLGQWKFMPYRITLTDSNGQVTKEFSVDEVINWTTVLMEHLKKEDPMKSQKLMIMTHLYHGEIGNMYNLWQHIVDNTTKKIWDDERTEWLNSGNYHGDIPVKYQKYTEYLYDKWRTAFIQAIKNDKHDFEIKEPMCKNKVPREGFVFRKVDDPYAEAFKIKTIGHMTFEKKALDKGETDIETEN